MPAVMSQNLFGLHSTLTLGLRKTHHHFNALSSLCYRGNGASGGVTPFGSPVRAVFNTMARNV